MILDPASLIVSLIAALGVWLPGAAVLAWQPNRRRTGLEGLAVSFGLGMAIIALAALAGRIASFSFTPPLLMLLEFLSMVVLIAGVARRKAGFRLSVFASLEILALLVLLGLRFFQARDLALPAWVDSIHHTFLVRMILERGGLPADLLPWIPGPFYYHFGFHSAAAVVAALSGLSPDRVILVFGQILGAAAALSVYRLAMAFRADRRRALLAMALAGFVAQMPAYYLAWGRYTLLAGMVLLPLAMAEAVEFAARTPRRALASQPRLIPKKWSGIKRGLRGQATGVRLAILTAGVLLTHYLAGILLAVFLVLIGACILLRDDRRERFPGLALSIGAGTAMALPWLLQMLRNSSGSVGVDVITLTDSIDAVYFANYTGYLWKLLGPLRNYLFLGAGLLAALAAMLRRGPLRLLALWGLILGLQTLPWGLRIEPFRPDHLAIVLFLPAAILAAHGFCRLAEWVHRRRPVLRPRIFLAGAMLGCCLAGVWQTRTIVPPTTVFADSDDRAAVMWAGANTPPDAVFLINTAPWQSGLYRGVDGGWWLLPLADRRTLLPPMLFSFAAPGYVRQVNQLAYEVFRLNGCTDALRDLVREQGVTHIYIKEGAGSLKAADLDSCPGMAEIFRIGKVRIYRINSAP
jgi:hypothetical protein